MLKEELCLDKNEKELDDEILDLKNSNNSMIRSRVRREGVNSSAQTDGDVVTKEVS